MNRKIISSVLIINFLAINSAFAGSNFTYEQPAQPVNNGIAQPVAQYPQNNTLHGNVIMVPAGETVKVMLTTPISSETATAGQTVSMALNKDYCYNGKVIAPSGSTIYGTVIEASKAKRGNINGKLCIRFNQIYTPYGTQIPISAVIKTDDMSGVLVGGTALDATLDYAKDATIGVAAGALSGVVFGALAGGSVGRAAALGTAVGAGGGLVKSAFDKGKDVTIPANASIDLVFTQPVSVGTSNYFYEN